jgi:hypothetical protein
MAPRKRICSVDAYIDGNHSGFAHIPGANIKEFLGTILSEPKRQKIPRLSWDGEFLERKAADQKFFSVSRMGFGQQPKRH